ncbi:MAG: glycosyltransferase family 4 protein [Planctomycetaceae bacterium]|nr:glycosyltransferase family 4 protein [Planctomycetaceae bacterium]
MKILLLCDFRDNWSIHNRTKAISKFCPQYEFAIRETRDRKGGLWREDQFDVVHFNFSGKLTDYAPFILAERNRVLLTVANERSYFDGFGVDREVYRELLRVCRATSVSKRVADDCGATYIPNGIDEDIFDRHRNPVVGYAGTKDPNKNAHLIEQACRELGLEYRSAYYRGTRPDQPHAHGDMKHFYCGLDVYVHASATEGFNNTIIEALSCNVPVLMTRAGCWQEFEGWVDFIEPTVESIKAGLRKLSGRRLITDRFLWRNIVPRYAAEYEAIYAQQAGAAHA